eukprot:scaffold10833_cov114-Skeletonema_marinoi.AAC.1
MDSTAAARGYMIDVFCFNNAYMIDSREDDHPVLERCDSDNGRRSTFTSGKPPKWLLLSEFLIICSIGTNASLSRCKATIDCMCDVTSCPVKIRLSSPRFASTSNHCPWIHQKRSLGRSITPIRWPTHAEHRRVISSPCCLPSTDLAAARASALT